MLINEETKQYKNIKLHTEISAIIYYLNNENMNDKLEEVMNLITEYFNKHGIEDFNNARNNNLEEYMELGKNIGKIIGVKQSRILVDNSWKNTYNSLKNSSVNSNEITQLYKQNEIFPRYAGCTTTRQEYVWDTKYGLPEYTLEYFKRSELNTLIAIQGQPYQTVTEYSILDLTSESSIKGTYSNKSQAKEKLGLEEATDEPKIDTEETIDESKTTTEKPVDTTENTTTEELKSNNNNETTESKNEKPNTSTTSKDNSSSSKTNTSSNETNNKSNDTSESQEQPTVKNVTMPNLVGLTRSQAESKLNELGISFTVEKTNSLSKDTVFSQSVASGTSKPISEYGTITIKTYEKVSAIVRVNVKNTDSSKKYELVGKPVKVVLNGQSNEDSYFNGESTSRNFLDITTPNITVQVYVDNELVKTQEFNIEELVQKSEYYTDVTINI